MLEPRSLRASGRACQSPVGEGQSLTPTNGDDVQELSGGRDQEEGQDIGRVPRQPQVALFEISISNIDCRYIDTSEKY